jgi:endonuclease YncB( thermonuclease family)
MWIEVDMSTLDKVRAIIRAEVERAHPIADARGPLELIVESAVRYSEADGTLTITVLDEAGQPSASRTIADVIADFRAQHPTLFQDESAAAPAPAGASAAGPAAPPSQGTPAAGAGAVPAAQGGGASAARAGAMPAAAAHASAAAPAASEAAPRPRDWLIVGGAREAPAAAPPPSVSSRLDEGLDTARAGLTRVADRLTLGPQALAARLGRVGQALRATVSMARATLQDFGDRPAPATAGPVPAGAMPSGPVATGPAPRAPRVEAVSARATREALIAAGATPWFRRRHVLAAGAGALALVLGGAFLYSLLPFEDRAPAPSAAVASAQPPVSTAPARRPATPDPGNTGSVPAAPPPAAAAPAAQAAALPPGALRGVPEVIDTATLSVGGKVVPLFGVQWSRGGGEPSDLAGYLRNREVTCRPAEGSAKAFRCEVDGQDLSKVVLFNGGGRATQEASPDLLAAEAHARSARTGLWAKANP